MRYPLPGRWSCSNSSSIIFTYLSRISGFGAVLLCGCLSMFAMRPAFAQSRAVEHPNCFTIYFDNDFLASSDRDYTNGLRLTWSRLFRTAGETVKPGSLLNYPLIDRLPYVTDPRVSIGLAFSMGQSIYTPQDTQKTEVIEDDRPYAAYLYLGMGLHAYRGPHLTLLELDLGVVGPLAMGEELQNGFHHLIDNGPAKGWDNQLNNEPAVELIYESKWRVLSLRAHNGWGVDLIPHVGGRLGNVAIEANTGAEFRFGWHLLDRFGSCPIHTGCDSNHMTSDPPDFGGARSIFGVNLFFGLQGSLVLHDIFLDGNTFSYSHSVDRKPLVAEAMTGIALHYKRFRLIYSYVWNSKQFEEQERKPIYGSITLSFDY